MYVNNCAKCGTEFETKNPKRVICPNCLYPERPSQPNTSQGGNSDGEQPRPSMPGKIPSFQPPPQNQGGPRPGGYGPPPQHQGGPRPGGYGRPPQHQGGPRPGGYGPPRGRGGPPPRGRGGPPKKLLISREDMEKIEALYKQHLPLPNPDVHEIIGEKLDMKPSMVFFGINLIREKMRLPKLEYPKRRLALTPDQLMAIESLYEPYLPVPPIGIHKILSKQLKIDEWRVHVGIGLIRKNKSMPRWNEERDDLPEAMKKSLMEKAEREKAEIEESAEEAAEAAEAEKETKKKSPSKSKTKKVATQEDETIAPEALEEAPAKTTKAKKTKKAVVEGDEEKPAKKPVKKTTRKTKAVSKPVDPPAEEQEPEVAEDED